MSLPVVRFSVTTLLMFEFFWGLMFSMGLSAGAEAAVNDSVSVGEIRTNISTIEAELHHNLSRDLDAGTHEFVNSTAMSMVEPGFFYTRLGLELGYRHPTIARPVAPVLPYALVGVYLYYLWRLFRRLRRGVGRLL